MPTAAKVSRHDSSPATAPRDQTDPKKLENAIATAEHARAAKGGPAQASPNEVPYQVHSGDTMWRVAQSHGDKLSDVVNANPQIANPDRIKDGDILFLPTKDPATVGTRQKVADAEAADRSVAGLEADLRNPKLSTGMRKVLNEELTAARSDASAKWSEVQTSVENELRSAGVGKALPDPATNSLVADIRARAPDSEKFQNTVDAALQTVRTQAQTDRQVQDIVTKAQTQSDPLAALRSLNDGYKNAPQDVKDALLRDPGALKIIDGAVTWANQPLQQPGNAIQPQGQT
jgi:LysM repeat protein